MTRQPPFRIAFIGCEGRAETNEFAEKVEINDYSDCTAVVTAPPQSPCNAFYLSLQFNYTEFDG